LGSSLGHNSHRITRNLTITDKVGELSLSNYLICYQQRVLNRLLQNNIASTSYQMALQMTLQESERYHNQKSSTA
jgi:hypothetical protein